MATGYRPNATTDFLEEWKAKREKMRAKMLGDIAASTGGCSVATGTPSLGINNKTTNSELNNNGNAGSGGSSTINCVSSYPVVRSSSSTALSRRPEDDQHQTPVGRGADPPGGNLKKTPQPEKVVGTPQSECSESGKDSPSPVTGSSKGKEKKSSGPSARKGKGQIERRKLREKRRSTGVVNIPSNESLDELEDDEGGEKERKREEALTQHNTAQNEALTPDPAAPHFFQETPRAAPGRQRSAGAPGSEEEGGGASRHRLGYGRHGRDSGAAGGSGLERRIEELEKELAKERQENARLLSAHQDKDDLIAKLKEEIDLLNRDLDDIEEENEQLKQENKTLLKVVGQLTR
ncbi:PRKC apoptosis WT1 regulator protein-like [Anguilla anguilla]|uniref:PRKC apoptosis WT1 regulator protein-like n=1 Tax=Anguilla anguilla TaxID=7936 RepID=UPI0015AE8788|nr:PRKC apoptosis WT1 regulator protein-like [Anguilla anguilla]